MKTQKYIFEDTWSYATNINPFLNLLIYTNHNQVVELQSILASLFRGQLLYNNLSILGYTCKVLN